VLGLGVVLLAVALPQMLAFLARGAAPPAGPGDPILQPPPRNGLPAHLAWCSLLSGGLCLGIGLGIGLAGALLRREAGPGVATPGRLKLLTAVGATSLAVYGVNFLLLFPLWRYYNLKRASFGKIAAHHAGVALGTAAAILALFLLYYLAYRLCRKQNDRRLWAIVLVGGLLLALVTCCVALITTLDPYDYMARGRITGVYGGNPYVEAPEDYPADRLMQHVAWRDATSAYGPLWEVLSGLVGRWAGDRLWLYVLAYKGLALASYLISTLTIAAILRRAAPERALSGTLLYAWNPLILLESLANAHNDALMIALILGAFWALGQTDQAPAGKLAPGERTWRLVYGELALFLLGLAVLVKFVPILLLPLFLLYLLAGERGWRRQLGLGLLLLVPLALIAVHYYRPFWQWPDVADTLVRRVDMFRMSIASLVRVALEVHTDRWAAQAVASWPFVAAFALSYAIVWVRAACALCRPPPLADAGQPWRILVRACLNVLLLYLLLASFWFWPWYLAWPIALLALSGDERILVPLTLAGCAGELSHVAWNFLWYWMGIEWDTLYQVEALVVFSMVVPALLAYAIPGRERRGRSSA
jgi:hypothetical protein